MSFKSERLPECVRLPQLERSAAYNSAVDLDVYAIYLLGAVEPRTFRRGGKLHYKSLARQAADFRDNLWKACAAVARERTVKNTFYRQIEERAKLADELPEIAPFASRRFHNSAPRRSRF